MNEMEAEKNFKNLRDVVAGAVGVLEQMIEEIRQLDKRVERIELEMPTRIPNRDNSK